MEIKHVVQRKILKKLLFKPDSKFSELNSTNLDNNHFNFHLKHLVNLGLIEKDKNIYKLTPIGLELAGRMDTKSTKFVRQPKLGVCIFIKNDNDEILLGKRLKDPGKGKYYFFTKKVEFGKSVFETASECLVSETGLFANFEFAGNIRHIGNTSDVLFVCLRAKDISGQLIKTTKESSNVWVKIEDFNKLDNTYPFFEDELKLFMDKSLFFQEFHSK